MQIQQQQHLKDNMPLEMMFAKMNGVYIKQKIEWAEVVSGCETRNKYYVFERDVDGGKKGKKLLKCKEKSGCCERQCYPPDCRPFNMKITNERNHDQEVLWLERKCKCTFYCANRPEMDVYLIEGGQQKKIGRIVDPWDMCNYAFKIYDENEKLAFTLEAKCCQLGFYCQCPCKACETIVFDVYEPDKAGEKRENLVKKGKDCLKNAISSADNFSVPFPPGCSYYNKLLLTAATLFIDFRMFENKDNGKSGGGIAIDD